jgi:hypothetical protein
VLDASRCRIPSECHISPSSMFLGTAPATIRA